MKPLLARSCNWVFNSFNLARAILYDGIEMRVDPGNKSILNSNSRFGGNLDKSLKNTSENSHTIGALFKVTFKVEVSTTCAK